MRAVFIAIGVFIVIAILCFSLTFMLGGMFYQPVIDMECDDD